MTRLYQDLEFTVDELRGVALERVVAFRRFDVPSGIELLLIKARGPLWHRCFCDAGVFFWERWRWEEASDGWLDDPEYQLVDLGTRFGLLGAVVRCAAAVCADPERPRLEIETDRGILGLTMTPTSDSDAVQVHFESRRGSHPEVL